MRRVEQGRVGEIVVVDDGPGEGDFVRGQGEGLLQVEEAAVRVVDDQLAVKL